MTWEDKTPKNTEIRQIHWSDYTTIEQWNDTDEDVDDVQMTTCGWLLEDSDKRIVIAKTYSWTEERWAEFHVFPKATPHVHRSSAAVHPPGTAIKVERVP